MARNAPTGIVRAIVLQQGFYRILFLFFSIIILLPFLQYRNKGCPILFCNNGEREKGRWVNRFRVYPQRAMPFLWDLGLAGTWNAEA